MKAEIITIGDEILIGQTIDTNSAWLGVELNLIGIDVVKITTISDNQMAIINALKYAVKNADLVIVTGGLGPTQDDITKMTLCEFFNDDLERNEEVLEKITTYFEQRGRTMLEINKQQADLPKKAQIIENKRGTASGMWFRTDGVDVISMPGVPFEMKAMMKEIVIPELKRRYVLPKIYHRNVLTQGIGESFLAEKITSWETKIRQEGFGLAYLPSASTVKLRITSTTGSESKFRVDELIDELKVLIPEYIYGYDDDLLTKLIATELIASKQTLGVAESCTGGFIGHLITSNAGSSAYFNGGIVAYSNDVKRNVLGVTSESLEKHGAVSLDVVEQMAEGSKACLNTDWAISTSGIAGPDGGTNEKPVGTVCIAVSGPERTVSKCFTFGNMRDRNIKIASITALHMLLKEIRE